MENLKKTILEKIIEILNSFGVSCRIETINKQIVMYDNTFVKEGLIWTSSDYFLFGNKTTDRDISRNVSKKIWKNESIFRCINRSADTFCRTYQGNSPKNPFYKIYLRRFKANKILSQICGDSLEEIAIKMDLAGI